MPAPFVYRRRVEFRDTDMAGIAHFSVFFTYMEEAEHQLLRSCGLGVFIESDGLKYSWPRVAAQCDYRQAVRFEDEVEIRAAVERIGKTSVAYRHLVFSGDVLVAEGRITTVCCRMEPGQRPVPTKIPEPFVELLRQFEIDSPDEN